MAEPDEGQVTISAAVLAKAAEYLRLYNEAAQAESAAKQARAELLAEIGDIEKHPDIVMDGQRLVYGTRRTARKPDAVALMRAGVAKEEFSTVTPTLAAFWKMVDRKEWNRDWAEQAYIIDTGESVHTISVRTDHIDEEE